MTGINYLIEGFKLIAKPKIRRFVYIPVIINIIIFIVLWGLAIHFFHGFIDWLNHFMPSWLHWLDVVFWLVYLVTSMLITAYIFTWAANLIAAPFYGLLSESIQDYIGGKKLPESTYAEAIKDTPRLIGREFKKLGYYTPRAIGIFIISLIPGINIIATALWFIFGSWMQAIQYLDYPMDNNRLSFDELRHSLRQRKTFSFIFGASIMLLMMVPFLNIILIPAAVAGATKAYVEVFNEK
jgi:CysZ protein